MLIMTMAAWAQHDSDSLKNDFSKSHQQENYRKNLHGDKLKQTLHLGEVVVRGNQVKRVNSSAFNVMAGDTRRLRSTNHGKVLGMGMDLGLHYYYKDVASIGGNISMQNTRKRERLNSIGAESVTYGDRVPNLPYTFDGEHHDPYKHKKVQAAACGGCQDRSLAPCRYGCTYSERFATMAFRGSEGQAGYREICRIQ